jgi:signal transduction histidine kinase
MEPTPATPAAETPPPRFRLLRYFTLATLVVFAAAGLALWVLQRGEEVFFDRVQQQQREFFSQAQAELARQNEQAARASLLAVHEASHVTLTRVVANLLWASDFAPLVGRAQALPVEPCRALAKDARRPCWAEFGRRVQALPGFASLDDKAHAAMRSTKVFKMKVWDLRGITVYSSEPAQIGEDGSANQGWIAAVAGKPASELTHRESFSAFEGTVENRDLISTYVPVFDAQGDAVVGVFELYSDVTPFLAQTRAAAQKFADIAAANDAAVAATSRANQQSVNDSSDRFLLIVGGLLVLLYGASLLIVRIGQRIIDRQTLAQEQATRREALWHREKMAALSTMAANVSHEVGNPLAVIAGVAQQLPDDAPPPSPKALILEQTDRIARMTRRISDFANARGGEPEWVDVNAMLKAVCDFHAFDRRFRGLPIEFDPAPQLPARELVPDHLNEVMMNVLQAIAEGAGPGAAQARIVVSTRLQGEAIVVRIAGAEAAARLGAAARLNTVARRVHDLGARLETGENGVEITLPAPASGA